ncbi:MAG: hypothetical protein SFY81_14650 [Verrucomicrobiota bacterium]|nr:hypothetical protein [Verrucomicrobiota bacterium]
MNPKTRTMALVVIAVLIAVKLAYLFKDEEQNETRTALTKPKDATEALPSVNPAGPPQGEESEAVIRVLPGQVLATINGKPLIAEDVWPLGKTNQLELSSEVYHFFLERAINRELIFQTAKQQGIELSEAHKQRLAQIRMQKEEREPGVIEKLNRSDAASELELRDSEAFMLQTEMMAARGESPNVSEREVIDFYAQHQEDYAELPQDEEERARLWSSISFSIRQRLANSKRTEFNRSLDNFMTELKSSAQVAVMEAPESPRSSPSR